MRGSRLLKRIPKLPKFPVRTSDVTAPNTYGARSPPSSGPAEIVVMYHERTVDCASAFTSLGDASARATSGLLGFVTSRLLHPSDSRTAAAPISGYRFFICIIGLLLHVEVGVRT